MKGFFRTIGSVCRIQLILRSTSRTWIFVVAIQPVLFEIISLMILKHAGYSKYSMYAVLGAGMMGVWSSTLFSSGFDIFRERTWGTLEALVGVPTPLAHVIIGKSLVNSGAGLFSMLVAYLCAFLFFGHTIIIVHPFLFIFSLIITLLSVAALGLIICTGFTLSRAARGLVNVLENPIFILCGLMFPVTILPIWVRPLSYVLSPTWCVLLLRSASEGITDWVDFFFNVVLIIGLTLLYVLVAMLLFRRVESLARKSGTLGVY